ncbi:MAG TPA: indole-3-glycerol phosphate synthase TrpC [Actinomycetota bacterium]|nr:indole-3-glycerol phosphate synthase TrpC [Actinomycetota bacterium]
MGTLTELVDGVRRRMERDPPDEGRSMALAMKRPPARGFERALREADPPGVIAEFKRASPSAGEIADVDVADRARAYEAGGACAISVLTEPTRFWGALADLQAARLACRLPVLRKDFLVHPAQVIESRASGADAVLLIAAALTELELKALRSTAADLGMDALVETHSRDDLDKALATDAPVVGVNARDLETLEVDVDRALELLSEIPGDRVAVLESGVSSREQVERALEAGARAVLVGEALMRAADPEAMVRELRGPA